MNSQELITQNLQNAIDAEEAARIALVDVQTASLVQRIPLLVEALARRVQARGYLADILSQTNPCDGNPETFTCYESQLADFGIGLLTTTDMTNPNLAAYQIGTFTLDQLKTILLGVQQLSLGLTLPTMTIQKQLLNPTDVFKLNFGAIKFGFSDDAPNMEGLAIAPNPQDFADPIFILLGSDSFTLGDGLLHRSFVVVHELGHAFHNRHGGEQIAGFEKIASSDYVNAVGSCWNPFSSISTTDLYCGTYELDPRMNDQGQFIDFDDNVTPAATSWVVPEGLYISDGYAVGEDIAYFPNERRQIGPNPTEGFSDVFANYFLNRSIFPSDSSRLGYFDDNLGQWISRIIELRS